MSGDRVGLPSSSIEGLEERSGARDADLPAPMIARDDLTGRPLLEVLRWRSSNGDIYYWRFLVGSVGATLALTFLQVDIWGGGQQPWSLLAPVLAPFAIYFFVRGWAYAEPLPYLCGFLLLMVGGVLPFVLIQPV